MPGAIEEVLHLESPEQRTSFRIVRGAVQTGDVRLEPGRQVGGIIGRADRDAVEFSDPDRFDIRRSTNRHLAIGIGLHRCREKAMARTQGAVAIGRLLQRMPGLVLEDEELRWRRNSFFRSLRGPPAAPGVS